MPVSTNYMTNSEAARVLESVRAPTNSEPNITFAEVKRNFEQLMNSNAPAALAGAPHVHYPCSSEITDDDYTGVVIRERTRKNDEHVIEVAGKNE